MVEKGLITKPLVAQEEANTILESIGRAASYGYYIDRKAKRELNKYAHDYVLTAQADKTVRAESQAMIDSLTGLPNRRSMMKHMTETVSRHDRLHIPFSVLYLDIDEFKFVNDTFGHATGDALLCNFAAHMGNRVRSNEMLARVGGDEFVIVMERPSKDADVAFLNYMNEFCQEIGLPISVSVGSRSVKAWEHVTVEEVLRQADSMMYEAKKQPESQLVRWPT